MSELHTKLTLEVEVLSPLHIGTGSVLLLDYDLVVHGGRTFRVDEDAVLRHSLLAAEAAGAEALNRVLMGRPAGELLDKASFDDPGGDLFLYVLDGAPSKREGEIVEQIKDVYGQLYLPGSSLKGALRTILAWGIYDEAGRKPNLNRLGRSRSWASQPLEKELFGRNPNYDWLRAVQVSDSRPLPAGEHLALRSVRVYPTAQDGSSGLDVDVEAIEPGAVFETQIAVEGYGFESPEAAKLGWQGKRRWLQQLPHLARKHAQQRLLTEAEYFKGRGGPVGALRFYDGLVNRFLSLPGDTLVMQVGWGAGWESKTLGSDQLRQSDRQFEDLLSQYRMTKERGRRPGDPFPRSRHLALAGGRPALPMGWVEVRIGGLEELTVTEKVEREDEGKPKPPKKPIGEHTGRLKTFFPGRGFGFIQPDEGGDDVFVHVSNLADSSAELRQGQRLAYDVEIGPKGPRAVHVQVLG